jgi:hypothetical protein
LQLGTVGTVGVLNILSNKALIEITI